MSYDPDSVFLHIIMRSPWKPALGLQAENATKRDVQISKIVLPLISLSGLVPGNVHIAWARCPKTVASRVESFGPMMYFLSPVNGKMVNSYGPAGTSPNYKYGLHLLTWVLLKWFDWQSVCSPKISGSGIYASATACGPNFGLGTEKVPRDGLHYCYVILCKSFG